MSRALASYTVADRGGNVIQNAAVYLYQPGTTTAVLGTMYDAPNGGNVVTNPRISGSSGVVQAWLDTAQPLDLKITDNGHAAYLPSAPSSLLTFADSTVAGEAAQVGATTFRASRDGNNVVLSKRYNLYGGVITQLAPNPPASYVYSVTDLTKQPSDSSGKVRDPGGWLVTTPHDDPNYYGATFPANTTLLIPPGYYIWSIEADFSGTSPDDIMTYGFDYADDGGLGGPPDGTASLGYSIIGLGGPYIKDGVRFDAQHVSISGAIDIAEPHYVAPVAANIVNANARSLIYQLIFLTKIA